MANPGCACQHRIRVVDHPVIILSLLSIKLQRSATQPQSVELPQGILTGPVHRASESRLISCCLLA